MSRPSLCKRFAADQGGVVAVILAFVLVPLLMAVGGAIDYGRATHARVDLQSAVDAAALTVGRVAIEQGRTDNTVQARQAFDAGFKRSDGTTVVRFDVTQDLRKIVVDADARVPLAFAGFLNMNSIDVNARAEVPLDDMTVEVALVLDNSGSMGSGGRMTALQTASKNLITKLQNASVVNTNAFIGLVPFNAQVRLPVTLNSAPDPVNTLPGVRINHTKDAAETRLNVTFPWYGCFVDRDKPHDTEGYDAQGSRLETARPETLLPAANCDKPAWSAQPVLRPVLPLNRQFDQLRAYIDSMIPDGGTNASIGLASGLALLTPDLGPLPTGARQPSRLVKKHMIFLTDGLNFNNRWTTDTAQIDQQTQLICNEIRQSNLNIVLHTILLMGGNPTLLQNCATTPQRYYFVTDPAQLNAVFDAIAAELLSIRLAY